MLYINLSQYQILLYSNVFCWIAIYTLFPLSFFLAPSLPFHSIHLHLETRELYKALSEKILCFLREFEVLCLLFIETKIQYTNQLRAVLPHMPIKNLCHTGWHIWQRFVWWIKNYNIVLIPNFIFQIYF